jgi:hypothetical protein
MRHSSLDLTMNVYTDPSLLDVAGALEALRELSLDGACAIRRWQRRSQIHALRRSSALTPCVKRT